MELFGRIVVFHYGFIQSARLQSAFSRDRTAADLSEVNFQICCRCKSGTASYVAVASSLIQNCIFVL